MSAELLTVADVAKRLGISEILVKRLTLKHQWPCVRFSARTIRYSEAHIEQIIARSESKVKAVGETDEFAQTSRSKAKSA